MLAIKKKKILELSSQQSLFEYLRKRLVRECFEEYSLATLFSSGRQEDLEMDELD